MSGKGAEHPFEVNNTSAAKYLADDHLGRIANDKSER